MRALLIVLDGVGCGSAPDAAAYGDLGANTLGHLVEAAPESLWPTLFSLGLWKILTGDVFDARSQNTIASYGRMQPRSAGKDSLSGHWELAGIVLKQPFCTFESLPESFLSTLQQETGYSFIEAQGHPSHPDHPGHFAFDVWAAEHLRSRQPILCSAPNSTLRIAAHESVLSPEALYDLSRSARRLADGLGIARVIAQPFTGEPGCLQTIPATMEHVMVPPRTIFNAIADFGHPVQAIGKVASLFSGSGITSSCCAPSNAEAIARIEDHWQSMESGLLIANLPDFDALHGHTRDVAGFANALAEFDRWLSGFLHQIESEDLLIICADHGNDPTFPGNDHTREEVPLMVVHDGPVLPLGTRKGFSDVAASLGHFFGLKEKAPAGVSFLRKVF